MRKKYLSALLFGALLFASAGTFTSCKDYDDDINNLQSQITANADAIKALQDLVNNGDYVTKVAKNADGNLVFTFSKSGDQIIELDAEQVGDVLSINTETGELMKNGEPTGWFATKNIEDKNCIKIGEDGCWQLLQDDGTYKSTNIPVSGVTAAQNTDTKQWTLTIVDAQGNSQQVVVPSAASVMSDLVLAGWIETGDIKADGSLSAGAINSAFADKNNGLLNIEYCWLDKIQKANYGTIGEETTWSAQKDVVKNQVLTSLRGKGVQLVTRVSPADLDLSAMKFTLQDSKGNTLPIVLNPSTNFTGTITRAANSSINMIPLDVTTDTYATADAYKNLYGNNDGKTLYSLVEASGARSNYGLTVMAVNKKTVDQQSVVKVDGKDPIAPDMYQVDINKANKLTFGTNPEYVYDYYVEAKDKAVADLFGLTIDKKNGTFTVSKLADQITTTSFVLYVYALHIDGKIYRSEITIKPSRKMVNEAILAAGKQVIKQSLNSDKTVDKADYMRFDISLDAMFTALGTDNTAKWTSATLGANTDFELAELTINDQKQNIVEEDYYTIQLLDKNGKVLDKPEKYYQAVTMRVYAKYLDATEKATLERDKNYELTINFKNKNTNGGIEILNTVKMTYTPVLPALGDYMQKHESFWNDDKTVLLGVDNSINEKFTAKDQQLNYTIKDGFKKLGSTETADKMNIVFELADNKVNNVEFVHFDGSTSQTVKYTKSASENTNYGKEFTVKVKSATYLTGYSYGSEELAAQTFKMKVLSPIVEGKIEVKEGTSVEVYASRNAELNIADLIGYNYNKQSYNLYMDVVVDSKDKDETKAYEVSSTNPIADNYADKAIASVKFESGDEQVFRITENMSPVDSSAGTPAKWNSTTKSVDAGVVTLDTSNISQDTQTTIKVTVTDIWGYEKTVEVPLTIKMAK